MTWDHNLNAHFASALHNGFEIVDFKPQQHTVPIRPILAIANMAVVVFYLEAVQLKNKLAV